MPMIPQINILYIKKRSIKPAMSVLLFFFTPGEKGTQLFYFRIRQFVVLYICGHHGGEIAAVEAGQKGAAFPADIVAFFDCRRIDKYPALLFICQCAFCLKTFNQRLDRFGAPACSLQQLLCDFIGIDRSVFPYDFHDFILSFGNLGETVHFKISLGITDVIRIV